MHASPDGKSRLALLALLCGFAAAFLAALVCARRAHLRGGEVARLQVQLAAANAEVGRLNALVEQAESESGHPIYSNQ